MQWKKIGRALLFPPAAVVLVLLPGAAAFLAYCMRYLPAQSVVAVLSYVLATYTLTICCCKIPRLLRFLKNVKENNKYAQFWRSDANLRVNVSLFGSLIWNTAYAVFQLGLGIWHHTFWFCSIAGYYFSLAGMRLFLVRHTSRHQPGEQMLEELRRYRACGIAFLLLNLTLSVMIFFMVYWDRTLHHNEITTITMATYTFGALSMAIVNLVKYRKYSSPVYSASKAISLAAACVSMLTLEATMLTTFDKGMMDLTTRRILLGTSGGAVSAFIIAMAIYMIVRSNQQRKTTEGSIHE